MTSMLKSTEALKTILLCLMEKIHIYCKLTLTVNPVCRVSKFLTVAPTSGCINKRQSGPHRPNENDWAEDSFILRIYGFT